MMQKTHSMSRAGDSPARVGHAGTHALVALMGVCALAVAFALASGAIDSARPARASAPLMTPFMAIIVLAFVLLLAGLLLLVRQSRVELNFLARSAGERESRHRRSLTERLDAMDALILELRAPLVRIELRCEGIPSAASLDAMAAEAAEMRALIDSMVGCLQGLRGTTEPPQWVDADSLLNQLVGDYRALGYVIDLEGRVGAPVPTCPGALRRIMKNLLDSAISTGGDVRISVATDSDRLLVSVANTGGVNDRSSPTRQGVPCTDICAHQAGSGLGLSIARRLAQAMKGDLQLWSGDDGRREGRLSLPLVIC